MINWDKKRRILAGIFAVLVIFAVVCFAKIYQPSVKTDEIYTQALNDFNSGKYQNSYYLFSKVTLFSNLKPIAIYHQAECARMLDDNKSAIKQYQLLFNNYPKHKLSVRAKYLAAQLLAEEKPQPAQKYFQEIIEKYPDSDYATGAEYQLASIIYNKYTKDPKKIFPQSVKLETENYFRHYLEKSPNGRWAANCIEKWLSLGTKITDDDYLLIANSFYQSGEYEKAEEILRKVSISDSWVLEVKNLYALKNYPAAKAYAQSGLEKYSSYVENQDVNDVIDIYIKMSSSQTDAINYLLTKIQSKGKDYLLSLKCANSPENEKFSCYNNLYLAYPNEQFSADALANIFFGKIKLRDYANAQKIGKDHLEKFPDSASSPMVTFWMGKIAEYYEDYNSYTNYYKKTITRFPDTYYAYRAYLRLSRINNPIITSNINYKQVEYPYKKSKNNIIIKLAEFKDYDVLNELCEDEFIKSWIFYKKGDYSRSMLIARDAMEKINPKPDKYDLRWRLVYPLNYYDEIKNYSGITGNNFPLIMSLVREESYFDTLAQSSAGAVGLMQLMPSTAYEISSKYGLGINSYDALFNPAANLKAGNYYYSNLRSMLSGYDISAIAAYNGGIGSLQKWRNTINYNDTDEFVEQIPYLETRNYVRKVFRSYWNYIRIYSGNN